MRREFIDCKSRTSAKRRAPWAARIVLVEGGYLAFESWNDFNTWRRQR